MAILAIRKALNAVITFFYCVILMNEKRQILLLKALKNNGQISITTANRLYSGNNGKDALISLEFQGYLKNMGFGNFKINTDADFPQSVVSKFKSWKNSQKDSSSDSSDSEFVAEPV